MFKTIRIVGCARVKSSYLVIYPGAVICERIFQTMYLNTVEVQMGR